MIRALRCFEQNGMSCVPRGIKLGSDTTHSLSGYLAKEPQS